MLSGLRLQGDVDVLERAFVRLHPGLYRYNTAAETSAAFDALRAAFRSDRTLGATYVEFSRFAASIRCGHTYANFFNQPDAISRALFEGTDRLPFFFEWIDDEIVVTKDLTPDAALPCGSRVLAIDGVPARTILNRLMTVARADGANDAKRKALLGVRGEAKYETFDVFFPMLFPTALKSRRALVRLPRATEATTVNFEPMIAGRNRVVRAAPAPAATAIVPLFSWRELDGGVALLTMPTWAVYESTWDWKLWLHERFDDLVRRGAPGLIVDLRGNEGGLDVGDVILSRVLARDTAGDDSQGLVRYRSIPAELRGYFTTYDRSVEDWGDAARALPEPWPTAPPAEYFALKRSGDATGSAIRAKGPRFTGKLAIIVDASNSSATFRFARLVRTTGCGTLVGQPTGGNLRGINGGAFLFLTLPYSTIELDLPLIGTFPASPQPDAGLIPDVLAAASADDVAVGRDVALAAALAAISSV